MLVKLTPGGCQSRVGGYGRCQYLWQFLPVTSNGRITFTNDGPRYEWWKDFDGFGRFGHFAALGHPIFWTSFLSFAKGKNQLISYLLSGTDATILFF